MTSIVLSFVGEQDPYSEKTKEEGSIVTLLRHLVAQKYEIKKAVLLHTEGTSKGALDTRDWIASESRLKLIEVELVAVSEDLSRDPTDLLKAAQEARRGLDLIKGIMEDGDRIEFNASSGTPAMKSAFSILQAAGYVANGQVWQIRNPKLMREDQSRVFETDIGGLRREFDLKGLRGQIEGFNYGAALMTLTGSSLRDRFKSLPSLLKAGEAWHRGEFDLFYKLAKSYLADAEKIQGSTWWWMAYEQAYTAMVRLEQGNTSEAMQHSFRAVEGALWEWAIATFPNDVENRVDKYPLLKSTILSSYPALRSRYEEVESRGMDVELKGYILKDLHGLAIPKSAASDDFREYWSRARTARNLISHRLGGISEKEVFAAWGNQIRSRTDLEKRLLTCLNLLTGKSFRSLIEASLFAKVHQKVITAIASYQP
jgi:hypothetical protein